MTFEEILPCFVPRRRGWRETPGVDSFLVPLAMSYQLPAMSHPPSTIILLFLLFLPFFQSDEEIGFAAANQNQQGFALVACGQGFRIFLQTGNFNIIDFQDNVPGLQADFVGRSPHLDFREMTPVFSGRPKYLAISGVTSWAVMPYCSDVPLPEACSCLSFLPQ